MYHGGTNFDRTSGLFVATSYDYDAPLDEYGLMREPKWGHLRNLHRAIKQCEPALVSAYPTVTWPGKNLEVTVYKSKSSCAAFLAIYDPSSWAKVSFQNMQYDLPPWSVSILPDCKTAVFNTAKVNAPSFHPKMNPVSGGFSWQSYNEETVSADDSDVFTLDGLVEQKKLTWDLSDYLWYTTNVYIKPDEEFLKSGTEPTLNCYVGWACLACFREWANSWDCVWIAKGTQSNIYLRCEVESRCQQNFFTQCHCWSSEC